MLSIWEQGVWVKAWMGAGELSGDKPWRGRVEVWGIQKGPPCGALYYPSLLSSVCPSETPSILYTNQGLNQALPILTHRQEPNWMTNMVK